MDFKTKEVHVAEYLREGILSGRLPRGTRLKQADIAEQLQLSITPVREAFRMLEAEGYVLNETHRGVTVAPFDASAAHELSDLRMMLESHLVLAALYRLTPSDYADLAGLQQEFEKAEARGDAQAARAINYRFHSLLYGAARLPQTLHFVQVLWAKYPFDLLNRVKGRLGRAAADHRELLKAMKSGDRKAVKNAIRAHIDAGWRELQSQLKTEPATHAAKQRPQSGRRKQRVAGSSAVETMVRT